MLRRWIYWLLVIAFLWLVASRFAEISDFSHILARGQFFWVLAAVGFQILHYLVSSASFRAAFATVGVESRVRELFPLLFSAIFVNVVAPAGGASGAALFVDHAARRGQPPARVAAGILLQLTTSLVAFMLILIAGLAYLGNQHGLELYQVIAALMLLLVIGVMSSVLLLAFWRPILLRFILGWLQRALNEAVRRVKRGTPLSEEWVEQHAAEFIEAGTAMIARPRWLASTLGVLVVAHLVNMAGLYTLFLAFSQAIPVGSLLAGYSIGILFLIISITPQGIGVVEGIMPLTFISLGVPNNAATLTVFAFRGLSLWLPLVVGFLLLRRTEAFRSYESLTSKPSA